jgi:hypothetical protein
VWGGFAASPLQSVWGAAAPAALGPPLPAIAAGLAVARSGHRVVCCARLRTPRRCGRASDCRCPAAVSWTVGSPGLSLPLPSLTRRHRVAMTGFACHGLMLRLTWLRSFVGFRRFASPSGRLPSLAKPSRPPCHPAWPPPLPAPARLAAPGLAAPRLAAPRLAAPRLAGPRAPATPPRCAASCRSWPYRSVACPAFSITDTGCHNR